MNQKSMSVGKKFVQRIGYVDKVERKQESGEVRVNRMKCVCMCNYQRTKLL